ncbi:CoA transferase [Saccharomonospora sp. NPDC046836]|uniref:CaiB/BaiF CoA transferase family protein n=1 Tax=Saccharomonospora sp. NPDC046836 TaxID=3156921 RepID=UPI0033E490B4
MTAEQRGPLTGVRVLDLGQIYAGGYAGFLLAAAGADVIKVEPPGGENLRRRGAVGGGAYPFAALNAHKRGVRLDLKTERGREVFRELVSTSDVVLENFAPGVMDRLGLGPDTLREINPRLVYGSVSGYGKEGPYQNYPAMDLTVQAIVGVMSTTGHPDRAPVKAGPAICDFMAGVHLYAAITTALYARGVTGRGDVVEVTMQEATYPALMSSLGLLYAGTNDSGVWRTGNRHSGNAEAPYNVYEAADGYIAILCVTDNHWQSLAALIGGPELAADERYVVLAGRVQRMDELDALVTGWTSSRKRTDVVSALQAVRVPCAPVKELPEVMADENLRKRGMLREIEHPELGTLTVNHSPLLFGDGTRADLAPSPRLGQHTDEVLTEVLGYSQPQLDELRRGEVI